MVYSNVIGHFVKKNVLPKNPCSYLNNVENKNFQDNLKVAGSQISIIWPW